MTRRYLIGLFVVIVLLTGCAPSAGTQPPASTTTTTNESTQVPEQNPSSTASLPEPTTGEAATATTGESGNAAPTITPDAAQPTETVDIHCTETDPHPIGQSIAETYHTTYEEVMTFFCTGVSFEDIVLAYQTAELSGLDVKEVLTMWYDFGNWDDVWTELGLN